MTIFAPPHTTQERNISFEFNIVILVTLKSALTYQKYCEKGGKGLGNRETTGETDKINLLRGNTNLLRGYRITALVDWDVGKIANPLTYVRILAAFYVNRRAFCTFLAEILCLPKMVTPRSRRHMDRTCARAKKHAGSQIRHLKN